MMDLGFILSYQPQWVLGLLRVGSLRQIAEELIAKGDSSAFVIDLAVCGPDESERAARRR